MRDLTDLADATGPGDTPSPSRPLGPEPRHSGRDVGPRGRADGTANAGPRGRADGAASVGPHGRAGGAASVGPHGRADGTASVGPHGRAGGAASAGRVEAFAGGLASAGRIEMHAVAAASAGRVEVPSGGVTPYAGTCPPRGRRGGGRVTILFLSADAPGERSPHVDEELRTIEQRLAASRHRDGFEIVPRASLRLDDLQHFLLEHAPDVVHFAGRGEAGADLALLDERGRPVRAGAGALAALFRALGADTSLVVFNAPGSAEQAEAARDSVGLAVGMAGDLCERSACGFAGAFYAALFGGRSVRAAFDLGVAAVGAVDPARRHVPRLLARPSLDAAKASFVARPAPRWRGELAALALALGAIGGLASALNARRVGAELSTLPSDSAARVTARLGAAWAPDALAASAREALPGPAGGPRLGAPPEMVSIPAGRVTLGAFDEAARPAECRAPGPDEGCAAAHPQRAGAVDVRGFELDATEVTNEAFARWLDQRPGDWQLGAGSANFVLSRDVPPVRLAWASDDCDGGVIIDPSGRARARAGDERRPVVCVTWQGAKHYCRAQGKRLPTDAEWELAAKTPRGTPFPWGPALPRPEGVAFGGRAGSLTGPREVAASTQDRSPDGAFDLGGNVAEWVEGGDGYARPLRGGSWWSTDPCHLLGSACALKREPTYGKDVGFRCARDAAGG